MKKNKFIKDLRTGLSSLPKEEIEDIIADYEEYFSTGIKKKRKEEDIVKALGEPKQLAKQLLAEYHVKKAQENKSVKNVTRAALAVAGIALFNIIIVMGPYIALAATLISLYIVAASLVISGVAAFAGGIGVSIVMDVLLGLAVSFAGIALIAFGALFAIGTGQLTRLFIKLTVHYLSLNKKIIRGEQA